MLNRILYIYSILHPATGILGALFVALVVDSVGYVQGMTDLVIPLLSAFLRPYLGKEISEVPSFVHVFCCFSFPD